MDKASTRVLWVRNNLSNVSSSHYKPFKVYFPELVTKVVSRVKTISWVKCIMFKGKTSCSVANTRTFNEKSVHQAISAKDDSLKHYIT